MPFVTHTFQGTLNPGNTKSSQIYDFVEKLHKVLKGHTPGLCSKGLS
jgi:hypothetical protein